MIREGMLLDVPTGERHDAPMLLETSDVARRLEVSVASVRRFADEGLLVVAAETPRGVRLFEPAVVEALRQKREARRRALEAVEASAS